jgi:hypothetical protein
MLVSDLDAVKIRKQNRTQTPRQTCFASGWGRVGGGGWLSARHTAVRPPSAGATAPWMKTPADLRETNRW